MPSWEEREKKDLMWTTVEGSQQYYMSGDKAVVVALNRASTKTGVFYGILISYPNRALTLSLPDAQKLKVALDNIMRFAYEKEGIAKKLGEVGV
jgi:hypothetical protein